jgi:hypothetical protein
MYEYEVEFDITQKVIVQFDADDADDAKQIADEMARSGNFGDNIPEVISIYHDKPVRVG